MYILIIVFSIHHYGINSQQIEFKTKQGCETAAKGTVKQEKVSTAFCIEKD